MLPILPVLLVHIQGYYPRVQDENGICQSLSTPHQADVLKPKCDVKTNVCLFVCLFIHSFIFPSTEGSTTKAYTNYCGPCSGMRQTLRFVYILTLTIRPPRLSILTLSLLRFGHCNHHCIHLFCNELRFFNNTCLYSYH